VAYPLSVVLADPAAAAKYLQRDAPVYGITAATGRRGALGAAILEISLSPLPALAAEGYPTERVRIVVRADHTGHAYPLGQPGRQYKHQNPYPMRDLCLQYPGDDLALRWLPSDGLEALVTLVHRHLMFEEAWRRTGQWPCEDAPHGSPAEGVHPVATERMRRELRRWVR
jgi:hypothetical protein